MRRPPLQTGRVVAGTLLLALLSYTTPALAQQPGAGMEALGASMFVQGIVAALITLIIGGGWILLAKEYTTQVTDRVLENPGETFLYGLGISIFLFVVIVLLAITIVGILLVIPLVIAVIVIAELGYLAAGRSVGDDWAVVLGLAIAVSAFVGGVPFLGGLVGFVISCMALGAVYLEYKSEDGESPEEPSDSSETDSPQDGPTDLNREPRVPGGEPGTQTAPNQWGADGPAHEPSEPADGDAGTSAGDDWKDESVSEWDWGMDDEPEADESESETDESERSDDR